MPKVLIEIHVRPDILRQQGNKAIRQYILDCILSSAWPDSEGMACDLCQTLPPVSTLQYQIFMAAEFGVKVAGIFESRNCIAIPSYWISL
jgi:hypothetical protein